MKECLSCRLKHRSFSVIILQLKQNNSEFRARTVITHNLYSLSQMHQNYFHKVNNKQLFYIPTCNLYRMQCKEEFSFSLKKGKLLKPITAFRYSYKSIGLLAVGIEAMITFNCYSVYFTMHIHTSRL